MASWVEAATSESAQVVLGALLVAAGTAAALVLAKRAEDRSAAASTPAARPGPAPGPSTGLPAAEAEAVHDPARLEEALEDMRTFIKERVAMGFDSAEDIVSGAVERAAEEFDVPEALLVGEAERITRACVAAHLREETTWTGLTDCDRLDVAFERLNENGIVARHNFWCCQNCGLSAMADEINEATEAGQNVVGYTFYHEQDTEGAAATDHLYLAFGTNSDEIDGLEIGKRIVATLKGAGLKVKWARNTGVRIEVKLKWQRRRAANSS